MNLIEEVGLDYFNDRFNGVMFEGPNGKPCFTSNRRYEHGAISCIEVEGTTSKPKTNDINLPYDFFSSMEVFAAPEIGWRQAHQGRFLSFFYRNNASYARGLSLSNMRMEQAPISQWASAQGLFSLDYYTRDVQRVLMAMRPEFTPLKEGIKGMLEGKLLSFAVSNHLAVVPDINDTMALMYNRQKVGTITPEGDIQCSIPFVCKSLEESA